MPSLDMPLQEANFEINSQTQEVLEKLFNK